LNLFPTILNSCLWTIFHLFCELIFKWGFKLRSCYGRVGRACAWVRDIAVDRILLGLDLLSALLCKVGVCRPCVRAIRLRFERVTQIGTHIPIKQADVQFFFCRFITYYNTIELVLFYHNMTTKLEEFKYNWIT
jgi:hypothetical protein